jgi:hypothetical protein
MHHIFFRIICDFNDLSCQRKTRVCELNWFCTYRSPPCRLIDMYGSRKDHSYPKCWDSKIEYPEGNLES